MSTDDEVHKYTVEFSIFIEVDASDAVDAADKARKIASLDDATIYVDGNLY